MPDIGHVDTILAVIVTEEARDKATGGGAPVFVVQDKEEQEK